MIQNMHSVAIRSIFKDVRTPIVIWRDSLKHHTEQVII